MQNFAGLGQFSTALSANPVVICHNGGMETRFLSLADVTEILQVPMSTVRALVKSGELRAIQVGGKGTWRVERSEFEAYIDRCYAETDARVAQPEP